MKINALREQRSAKVAQMKTLVDAAAAEGRDLSAEETTKFDQLKTEERALSAQIERAEYLGEVERRAAGTPVSGHPSADFDRLAGSVSVMKVIRAGMEGRSLDGAEAEYAREAERRSGRKAQGIYIPMTAIERRAVDTTAAPELVPTMHRPDQYVGALRNRLLARQLGVRVLDGLTGNVSIPKHGTGTSLGWVAEGGAVPESGMTFDNITLSPRHTGGRLEMSRQLIQQSSPAIEQLVRDDLAAMIAEQIDSAIINGSGISNEPKGILASIGSNGGVQEGTLAELSNLEVQEMLELLELANLTGAHWLGSPKVRTKLAVSLKESGLPGYLLENGRVADLPFYSTNQVPDASAIAGRLILGDFSEVFLGIWSDLDILVNPYAEPAYSRGGVVVRAMATVDVALRRPEAFVVAEDVVIS